MSSDEIGIEDMLRCEGCEALLHPDFAHYDVEGVVLCGDCADASPHVMWNGDEWVDAPTAAAPSEPQEGDAMTKRQRMQAAKADMLDALANTCAAWDPPEDSHGLTADEYADVQEELRGQIYAWAVRITPHAAPSEPGGEA